MQSIVRRTSGWTIVVTVLTRSILPNVKDEPRPGLARLVLLGARGVTAPVVGSGALLAPFHSIEIESQANLLAMATNKLIDRRTPSGLVMLAQLEPSPI